VSAVIPVDCCVVVPGIEAEKEVDVAVGWSG